jgi:nucleoside-diphosphate-sugar epimerase
VPQWNEPNSFPEAREITMPYTLLTGSTGFVGRFVLKEMLLADMPAAVLVRSTKRESARQRIEQIMHYWDQQLERSLPRPVILEGDVRQAGCGLLADDLSWLRQNCEAVVHSAASMKFHADDAQGEPYLTNVVGTANLLAVCQGADIRHFQQVSTAYVCGLRTGRILESELDLGQTNGNDYERSKMAAEKQIREASFLDSATFYRPASVLGDSVTGYTTNFHGFYAPLQVLFSMVKAFLALGDAGRTMIHDAMTNIKFMDRLNLSGNEGKNLVPVDWVAAVIVAVLQKPELHGETYHLTPRERTTVALVNEVFEAVLREYAEIPADFGGTPIELPQSERETAERVFREQMRTYDSHWRDDPYFDATNTLRAAPHLPCPLADRELLMRTGRYAVQSNFGWPRPASIELTFDTHARFEPLLAAGQQKSAAAHSQKRTVGLQITGLGGGDFTIQLSGDRPVAAQPGVAARAGATYFLNSAIFQALSRNEITIEQALYGGAVVIEGEHSSSPAPTSVLQNLLAAARGQPGWPRRPFSEDSQA